MCGIALPAVRGCRAQKHKHNIAVTTVTT